MTDHDHEALQALRDLDGPADLGDGVEARIEAEMLARFDERVGSEPADDAWTLVDLDDAREQSERRRPIRMATGIAAAAAAVVLVAGTMVMLSRDVPAPASPPSTAATTTVDVSAADGQLSVFCDRYIVPLRDADARWRPAGVSSESRGNVLIATEQAAQAMSELTGPLGDRLSSLAEQALEAAAAARLAEVLDEVEVDDGIGDARDLVLMALSAPGVGQLPASCLP